jgi:hypothetical protein
MGRGVAYARPRDRRQRLVCTDNEPYYGLYHAKKSSLKRPTAAIDDALAIVLSTRT